VFPTGYSYIHVYAPGALGDEAHSCDERCEQIIPSQKGRSHARFRTLVEAYATTKAILCACEGEIDRIQHTVRTAEARIEEMRQLIRDAEVRAEAWEGDESAIVEMPAPPYDFYLDD